MLSAEICPSDSESSYRNWAVRNDRIWWKDPFVSDRIHGNPTIRKSSEFITSKYTRIRITPFQSLVSERVGFCRTKPVPSIGLYNFWKWRSDRNRWDTIIGCKKIFHSWLCLPRTNNHIVRAGKLLHLILYDPVRSYENHTKNRRSWNLRSSRTIGFLKDLINI